jgi:hypothetical protein
MLRPVCIYVHKIVLQFYVYFAHLSLMWSVIFFHVSSFSLSGAILSQAGLLEVPGAYQGSLGYFLAQSLLLLNGCSVDRQLTGGPECAACLA